MTRSAFDRAERCFALARSTTFPAERDTAIARGTVIAEAAGIDLDRFDIPGRVRATPQGRQRSAAEQGARFGAEYSRQMRDLIDGLFTDYFASLVRAERQAGAQEGETAYDARRRNFDAACAAAKARDAQRESAR